MRFPGFIGPSYTLQSRNVDAQRCVNLYPELNELGTGKEREVAALIGTPGLRLLFTLPTFPVRGLYAAANGQVFAVGGNKLYRVTYSNVTQSWSYTELGQLNSSVGPVSMADNGIHVLLVDGPNGYVWTIGTNTFAQITDPDFLGADQVTFQDGYFILNKPDSGQFYISDLNDVSFDALDIATAEGSPDHLIGLVSDHQNLYLFGERSTEVFYNSGDADFPFQRNQGAILAIGCAATHSIAKLQNVPFWLGRDESGRGVVYRANGFRPERVSNHALEQVIADIEDVSNARAWVYQDGGHAFYCLNLTGVTSTWVYDASTNLWHERVYLDLGEYDRHRADCHAFAYNTHIVGDYENGKVYALDADQFTDDSNPIVRERAAPHVSSEGRRLFHSAFELDMETGVGTSGLGQGVDPRAMLQWSDDGGHSWSNERWANIGKRGERFTRVIWRRLGSSRDRVYRVRITDPVKVVMIGANLAFEEGAA